MTRWQLLFNLLSKVAAFLFFSRIHWSAVLLFIGPDLYLLYQIFVPGAQGLGQVLTRFETDRREVWLTIDDGPDATDTPQILELLDRHQARATFFLIGERALRHPELVAEITRRGNEVAHHTQTHPLGTFWHASPMRVGRELDDGLAALTPSGVRPRWFRAPVGIKNLFLRSALQRRGLACVGWSARGWDGVSRDPDRVVARILDQVKPGAVILMHEGASMQPGVRVEAIRRLLGALAERDFSCVLPVAGQLR